MPDRQQFTVTRFKGIDTMNSVANIAPDRAIDCMNVWATKGGELIPAQQPTVIIDWSQPGNSASNIAPVKSVGVLEAAGHNPRILIQQGAKLFTADGPAWSNITALAQQIFGAVLDRLDYVVSNSVLYYSTDNGSGKLFFGDNTYYAWGIARPALAPAIQGNGITSTSMLPVTSISRTGGTVTIVFGSASGAVVGQPVFVDSAGPWPASFSGSFQVLTVSGGGTTVTYAQPGQPNDPGPYARAAYPTTITATTGWRWGISLGYTRNGRTHWSTLSPYSPSSGPFTGAPAIMSPPSTDPQINQAALFRNLDGGDDWYLVATQPVTYTGAYPGQTVFVDTTTDDTLVTSGQTPPYDNGTPPPGKYLCPWLDRILMCGIVGDEGSVAYTGYDTINFGNPQESWCAFNRIKLGQGKSQPVGMGSTRYGGVVFFCRNREMYLLRGALSDINVNTPTSISVQAEKLPYEVGTYSHFSIQPTSRGLVWLDDGLNLRLFDPSTFYPPQMLAPNLNNFFKRMTPGSQDLIVSGFINLLQHEWYYIGIPIDGSQTVNLVLLVDMTMDQTTNTGAWPLQYALNTLNSVQYLDGSTHLLAASTLLPTSSPSNIPPIAGYLTEIPVTSSEVQGIQLAPDNPVMPNAYWRGGYIGGRDEGGQDIFSEYKFFRFINVLTTMSSLPVQFAIVDSDEQPYDNPTVGMADMEDRTGSIGAKGRVVSMTLQFPYPTDSSGNPITGGTAPIVGFRVTWNITGLR